MAAAQHRGAGFHRFAVDGQDDVKGRAALLGGGEEGGVVVEGLQDGEAGGEAVAGLGVLLAGVRG